MSSFEQVTLGGSPEPQKPAAPAPASAPAAPPRRVWTMEGAEAADAAGSPWSEIMADPDRRLWTVAGAMENARLGFTVATQPVRMEDGTDIPGKVATYRTDTGAPLGVVSDSYHVVQNNSAFRFFDPAIGEGSAGIETAGVFNGGRRVFMLARIPERAEVLPDDPAERYLLFTNGHDGGSAVQCLFTNVLVVCRNTLAAALAGAANRVCIRHTANAERSIDAARDVLCQEGTYWEAVRSAYQQLAQKHVTRDKLNAFLEGLFPGKPDGDGLSKTTENRRDRVSALFNGDAIDIDRPGKRGTAYGLFNAVTQWIDREQTARKGTDRWQRTIEGSGAETRQKAFQLLQAI